MNRRLDSWFLAGAGVLFGLFLLNIFAGKAALLFETKPIIAIGDVGEFLILFAAVIFFVVVILHREAEESISTTKSAGEEEGDTQ